MMTPKRYGIVIPILFAAFVLSFEARAQDVPSTPPDQTLQHVPAWVANLGQQLGEGLTAPAEATRHQMLKHVVYFSSFYGDQIDLSATVPHLLTIFENENEDERCRLMALAGLHAVGDEAAMQKVRRYALLMEENSPRVQLVTIAALADFYGLETFEGEEVVAKMAKTLFDYYAGPRVIVGPPILIDWEH